MMPLRLALVSTSGTLMILVCLSYPSSKNSTCEPTKQKLVEKYILPGTYYLEGAEIKEQLFYYI